MRVIVIFVIVKYFIIDEKWGKNVLDQFLHSLTINTFLQKILSSNGKLITSVLISTLNKI